MRISGTSKRNGYLVPAMSWPALTLPSTTTLRSSLTKLTWIPASAWIARPIFLLKHNKLLELEIKNSWFQHRIIADFGRFGSILAAFSDATNDGFSPLCQGQVVHDLLGPRFSIHVNIPNIFVSRTGCWRNLIGDHRRWNWTRAANQDLSGSLWLGHHGVLQLDTSYGKNLIGWMIWWSAAKLDDGSQKKCTRSGILFNESVCQLMVSWWFRWRDLGFTLPQSNNPFYL